MLRHIARIGLTVTLLLATQFAVAGQLCNSVMARGMMGGHAGQQHVGMKPDAVATAQTPPCCGGTPAPAESCDAVVDGVGMTAFAPNVAVPPIVALTPSTYATVMDTDRLSAPTLRAAASPGPPPPAYILLRRFLS